MNKITVTNENCVGFIEKYIEHAQQKGAYVLQEADLLQRSLNVLKGNTNDETELNEESSRQLVVQGLVKGQKNGAYTLADAAFLYNLVVFFQEATVKFSELNKGTVSENNENVNNNTSENNDEDEDEDNNELEIDDDDDDLSELSKPVPLIPKNV
jgi:hypothetical protein